jgi:N-acetylneuraminic acid mutarotase
MSLQKIRNLSVCQPSFQLLLLGLIIMLGLTACEKNTDEDDDLVGNWKKRSEFEGVGRTEAVSFTIGTKVYAGGGYDGSNRLNDFWAFDQLTGTWLRIADFPGTARNSAVAFSLNGKGYVGTGYDENDNKLKDFWEYNPGTNIWTRIADFGGTARYNAIGFAIDNKGYVGTGYDGNYLKDMWQYNPTTNTWAQVASLTGSKRSEAVVFVHNNLAYIVTGSNNGSYLNDFWVYNPATNTWAEKRKISDVSDDSYDDDYDENIKRTNAAVFLLNDKAYLVAGSRGSAIGTTWEYDISGDQWTQKTGLEGSAREGLLGFTIDNRGYIVTGNNSSFRFDDLWEFFPEEEQSDDDN